MSLVRALGAVITAAVLAAPPAGAQPKVRTRFHARASVGPAGVVMPHWGSTAHVRTFDHDTYTDFSTGYAGGGLALELAVGGMRRRNAGFGMLGFTWTEGGYFGGDRSRLARAGTSLDESVRFVYLGGGLERTLTETSPWRFGAAGAIGFYSAALDTPGGIEGTTNAEGGYLEGMFWIGPRWQNSLGPLSLGFHLRTSVALGLESAFAGAALLGDVAFP